LKWLALAYNPMLTGARPSWFTSTNLYAWSGFFGKRVPIGIVARHRCSRARYF
jgi:hypothetical protein